MKSKTTICRGRSERRQPWSRADALVARVDVYLDFIGRGGPQMRAIRAGNSKTGSMTQLSLVCGSNRNLRLLSSSFTKPSTIQRATRRGRADRLSGFNLRLAHKLRKRSPRQKIIYYISPQVWAWNRGRIKEMARSLDLMLCIFPFEADLYNKSGLRTVFVGHPMIDRLRAQKVDIKRDTNLIGLFPGSRLREVRQIFPVMLESLPIPEAKWLAFQLRRVGGTRSRNKENVRSTCTRSTRHSNQSRRNRSANAARVCRNCRLR